jgi:protease-4
MPQPTRFFPAVLGGCLGTLLALVGFGAVLVLPFACTDPEPVVADGSVLVVDLGALPEVGPSDGFSELLDGSVVTLADVTGALEKAAVDDRVRGLWLRPSGVAASWAGLEEVRAALVGFRASGKPIWADAGAEGYSEAGYYLASAADSVFSTPAAPFELDGFLAQVTFFRGTLDKLGVVPEIVRAGTYKSAGETFTERELSAPNREQISELVEARAAQFRETVGAARGVDPDAIESLIDEGAVFFAEDAYAEGLLDGLLYDDELIEAWRIATGRENDEPLERIYLDDYLDVSPDVAGLNEGDADQRIAVVYAAGTIVSGPSGPDVLGSDGFAEALREARDDESVAAVVIRVDSPGGSAAASDVMWGEVRATAAQVPVVVSMGGVAASGGYYLAAAADTVVADPMTITGSIGVISLLFDASGLLTGKLGLTFDEVKTGPYADLIDLTDEVTPAERQLLQAQTDRVYDLFVRRVADGRGLSEDSVRALGGGRVYTGQRAREVGLVDVLGGLDRAVAVAAEMAGLEAGGFQTLRLPRERPLAERLLDDLGMGVRLQAARLATPSVLREASAEMETLREARDLHAAPQARMWWEID